jgi:hypothetical protein
VFRSYPDDEPLPFDVIAAFLRLGRKYEIKPLYTKALSRLAVAFPSSVDEYINGEKQKYIVFSDPTNIQRGEIVIDTIVLARELNLPSLLPAAFWCVSIKPEWLANKNTSSIPEADRDVILLATRHLRFAYANYLFGWLDETVVASPDCMKAASCPNAKLQYSLKLWKPPGSSLPLYWPSSAAKGLCNSCVAVGKKNHSEGVRRLWKELPSFFNLPPWEELSAAAPN